MHAGLPLRIDPAPQPVRPELIVANLLREIGFGLLPEEFDILANRSIVFFRNELEVANGFGDGHTLFVYRDYQKCLSDSTEMRVEGLSVGELRHDEAQCFLVR